MLERIPLAQYNDCINQGDFVMGTIYSVYCNGYFVSRGTRDLFQVGHIQKTIDNIEKEAACVGINYEVGENKWTVNKEKDSTSSLFPV